MVERRPSIVMTYVDSRESVVLRLIAGQVYTLDHQSNFCFDFSFVYHLENSLGIKGDCSNFDKLPNIEIKLNARVAYQNKQTIETKIVLKPEDYIIEGSKIKEKLLVSGKEDCQPAFMAMDVPSPRGPIFVFGEYFLRKFYTVFDRDQKVFGFSLANHDSRLDTRSLNLLTPYDKLEVEIKSEEKELELCR